MLDTGSDLEPVLSKPSTLTVWVAGALSPLTRSDDDHRRHTRGWCEPILGGGACVEGGSESVKITTSQNLWPRIDSN